MKIKSRKVLIPVGVVVAVVVAVAVLVYPAWSARQGDDAVWVVSSAADEVIDFDADRLLVSEGDNYLVLDRATGATRSTSFAASQSRAALVPGGVVESRRGTLRMMPDKGRPWQVETGGTDYDLVAVTDKLAVAEVRTSETSVLTGFALTDGTPVWTVPDLLRVGFTRLGREPARPPRALHTTSLVAVQDRGGWHLVTAGTGERVVDVPVPEGDVPSVPIPTGDLAVYDTNDLCADITLLGPGATPVVWPDGPPDAECGLVWVVDNRRVLLIAPRDGRDLIGNNQAVRLYSLALGTGQVTGLDWRGTFVDLINANEDEIARSWGRYLALDGAVYDTGTGRVVWRGDPVWIGGDTAVTAGPVSGLDRVAPGVTGESLWVRLADAATGEPGGGEFVTDDPVYGVSVLDRGQVVVFAGGQAALLSR